MFRFWDRVVKPILEAAEPAVIVEIGAADGKNTANLLEFAEKRGTVVHVVDPVPGFDVDRWERRYRDAFVLHCEKSLDALPRIERPDVVLIDGDHNWYTVVNELRLLEKRAAAERRPFPVTLLHDVEWPYGRRDLYYDPDAIPSAHRQPFKRAGLIPGEPGLAEQGGINRSLNNAIDEHDRENGVRTAVEDFLTQSRRKFELQTVPGNHGLAVMVPRPTLERNKRLGEVVCSFASAEFLFEQCRLIEEMRLGMFDHLRAETEGRRSAEEQLREAVSARGEAVRELQQLRDDTHKLEKQLRAETEGRRSAEEQLREAVSSRGAVVRELEQLRDETHRLEDELRAEKEGRRSAEGDLRQALRSRDESSKQLRERVGQHEATVRAGREVAAALQARQAELAEARSALEKFLEAAERAAESRSWRYGHALMRTLRLLTLRRTGTAGALERGVERARREAVARRPPAAEGP
jgi:hypothetical protein